MAIQDTMECLPLLEERVLLMRSLADKPAKECRLIADDTIANYIGLAEELGLHTIQSELQELSVRYGYPEDYHTHQAAIARGRIKLRTGFQDIPHTRLCPSGCLGN